MSKTDSFFLGVVMGASHGSASLLLIGVLILISPEAVTQSGVLQLCSSVLSDGDINLEEGGEWRWLLSGEQIDRDVNARLVVVQTEQPADAEPACTDPLSLQPSSLPLRIHALVPRTFEWSGNAEGYPRWQISIEGETDTFREGVGRTLNLSPDDLALLARKEGVKLVFINRDRWVEQSP